MSLQEKLQETKFIIFTKEKSLKIINIFEFFPLQDGKNLIPDAWINLAYSSIVFDKFLCKFSNFKYCFFLLWNGSASKIEERGIMLLSFNSQYYRVR